MDETLIQNWNKVVKPGDIVYHLGDVAMGDRPALGSVMARLNGRKRLIVGNHDDLPWISKGGWFQKVTMWRMFPEYNMLFTHVPVHQNSLKIYVAEVYDEEGNCGVEQRQLVNVHGHIHQNPSPEGPYKCVCVEQTAYHPVHIEEILV
jgi:calcineurin-like phosphoesterase family protein